MTTAMKPVTEAEVHALVRNIRLRGLGNPVVSRCNRSEKRWNVFEMIERVCESGDHAFSLDKRLSRVCLRRVYAYLEKIALPEHRKPMPTEGGAP